MCTGTFMLASTKNTVFWMTSSFSTTLISNVSLSLSLYVFIPATFSISWGMTSCASSLNCSSFLRNCHFLSLVFLRNMRKYSPPLLSYTMTLMPCLGFMGHHHVQGVIIFLCFIRIYSGVLQQSPPGHPAFPLGENQN